jgi:hypothetical protein
MTRELLDCYSAWLYFEHRLLCVEALCGRDPPVIRHCVRAIEQTRLPESVGRKSVFDGEGSGEPEFVAPGLSW